MGKNIKVKEYGNGIFQRKDGWYIARFVDKYGKRHEKYFKTIPEARNWQADSQYQDRSIQTAMDRYVLVTDEAMDQAVKQFEKNGVSA